MRNTSLPAKHAHFNEMSGVTSRVQVRTMPAPPSCCCCCYRPGPWRVRSETAPEQPGQDGGPGAAARAPLQPSPLPDQHLPAPRAPKVMEARRSRTARGRSGLGRPGCTAAAGSRAAQAGNGAQERRWGEAAAAPPRPLRRRGRLDALRGSPRDRSRPPPFIHKKKKKGRGKRESRERKNGEGSDELHQKAG